MLSTLFRALTFIVICFCLPLLAGAAKPVEAFPLVQGNYWLYRGTAKWQENGATVNKTVTVKMQVLETIRRGHVLFAVLSGYPSDFQTDPSQPHNFLLIRAGAGAFYLIRGERLSVVLPRVRNAKDDLLNLVEENELFLDLPLTSGKVFGETEQITRQDGSDATHRWLWIVRQAITHPLKGIAGVALGKAYTEYKLQYRSNPDEQWVGFAPGIGITAYTYRHHPAIEAAQLSLVEFHQSEEVNAEKK